ncbi:hypothetical protein B0T10DRAFT_477582 [Thelonectria olida]|uniref:Uncharacterized protein n=1 Tax=Thelonectria olida TaxID=1576542 RepID=A0A9P8WB67_9HYPO|nr:hypothetical protein B0T10DRAFT_477582 [Thelonectria olida]
MGKATSTDKEASGTNAQAPSPSSSTDLQVDDTVDVVRTSTTRPADVSVTTLALSPGILAGLDMGFTSLDPLGDMSFPPCLQQTLTPGTLDEENSADQQDLVTASALSSLPTTIDPLMMSHVPMSADTYNLPLIGFTLAKALVRIADRLGCTNHWELDCISPFNHGTGTPSDQLPTAWRPTASQIVVPHHPIFDFLPWPGVRDRIINIMSLPDEMRPTNAKGPLALVNFAYDVEDDAEGVRIFGDDPYEPGSWEVGQLLFERWWFLFDREVIANSNRWRRMRGAPPLRLKGASFSHSTEGLSSSTTV